MLESYSDELSKKGCNDWWFPDDWTHDEKSDFVKRFHEWNGDPEEFDADSLHIEDFVVAGFLSTILSNDE